MIPVDGGLATLLSQEGKESTAKLQVLSLTALWLGEGGCAGTMASGALGGKDRSSAQPRELWLCLPKGMQKRVDMKCHSYRCIQGFSYVICPLTAQSTLPLPCGMNTSYGKKPMVNKMTR